jgi:prepilin-type N-terminal cleavage/methylation domain-containing protein
MRYLTQSRRVEAIAKSRRVAGRRAFTLVELIVASVIGAILLGATTSSVSMLLRAKATSQSRRDAFARADGAASRIALDAMCAVRDEYLQFTRVHVTEGGTEQQPRDELLLLSRSIRPVRDPLEAAEGGEYECQYRIMPRSSGESTPCLWRRVDHAFDENQDGGGVASPISLRVKSLSIEASDGESWYSSWDSDTDGMPHGLRVIVVAESDEGKVSATARRVIALDRVPIPIDTSTTAEEDPNNPNPSTQTPAATTPSTAAPSSGYTRTLPNSGTGQTPRGGPGGNRQPGGGPGGGGGRNGGPGGGGPAGGGNGGPRPGAGGGGGGASAPSPRGGGGR